MDLMSVAWQAAQAILFLVGLTLLCGLPFLLLACLVGLWEKRRVWPYEPCEEHEPPPPTGYARLMDRMAEEQGFRHLAFTRRVEGKIYNVRYNLWLSLDREVFAVVGSGTMAAIPVQTTWLFSKLVDGRALITLDHHSGVTHDPTGQWSYSLVLNADFPELLARHRARLLAEMTPVEPYSEDDPLADHQALRAAQADQIEAMGFSTYLDADRMIWRLTPKGAVSQAFQTYVTQWGQVLRNFSRQRLSRPGESGYMASDRGAARPLLRYGELACWVALGVDLMFMMTRPAATREQRIFRVAVGAAALAGIAAIRVSRAWLSWRQDIASGLPATRRLRPYLAYGAAIAVGLGVAHWQREQKRAERAEALAKAMRAMPKFIEADVSLTELEAATKAIPQLRYYGSDEEKHYFLDTSRPRTVRTFRVDRKEWAPPKVLDPEGDLAFPVAFREGKLTCLDPDKPEQLDPDVWIGDAR
jgi:hypothetical protein